MEVGALDHVVTPVPVISVWYPPGDAVSAARCFRHENRRTAAAMLEALASK